MTSVSASPSSPSAYHRLRWKQALGTGHSQQILTELFMYYKTRPYLCRPQPLRPRSLVPPPCLALLLHAFETGALQHTRLMLDTHACKRLSGVFTLRREAMTLSKVDLELQWKTEH